MTENLTEWADHLESVIEAERLTLFDRVFILTACASTQDAARRLCGSRPGAVVIAGRQTGGRGRLGREWVQKGGLGIAVTFVLPQDRFDIGTLSIAAGVAAAEAAQNFFPHDPAKIGVRWPNDVVCRDSGRKLAGVLIERSDRLAMIGVGMNVLQQSADWSEALHTRAVSLTEMGAELTRLDLARALLVRMEHALRRPSAVLTQQWRELDTLIGTSADFAYDNNHYQGVVEGVDPSHEIVVRDAHGTRHRLPCLQTALVNFVTPAASRAK